MSTSLQGVITTVLSTGNFMVYTEARGKIGQSYSAYRADNPKIKTPKPGDKVTFLEEGGLVVGACLLQNEGACSETRLRQTAPAR